MHAIEQLGRLNAALASRYVLGRVLAGDHHGLRATSDRQRSEVNLSDR